MEKMRIAYILSAYKYPEQLVRLVKRLYSDRAEILVHVDKKTTREVYEQMVKGVQSLPNVYFLKRHRCDWGGFGHVQASLTGIHEIICRKISYDYAFLLTGQDYPIKTEAQIMDFLGKHQGKSFIDSFPLPSDNWEYGGRQRIEHWHFRILDRHIIIPNSDAHGIKRKFPKAFRPYGGSSYWCFSKACIEYIDQFVRKNPRFVRFFYFVDVPDEIFFQTILLNSPHAWEIVNDDLRYIKWKDPNAGSPSILRKCDLENMASSPKLFARKFDMRIDAEVLDLIDQTMLMDGNQR